MDEFNPIINLVVVLTVLSITAERITNSLKLRDENLRNRSLDPREERVREREIQARSLYVGIAFSVLVNANFFQIVENLDQPWSTLGWLHVQGGRWYLAESAHSWGSISYSLGGCALTGFALGFGSKFWHDLLGAVYEVRNLARNANEDKTNAARLRLGQAAAVPRSTAPRGEEQVDG